MGRVFFLLVLLLVLGVWGSVFFADPLFGVPLPRSLNELGDSFGAVNALFAGLGFAGIVYSLHLQRTEIDKAAGQIDTQRQAIEALTESLTKQSDLLSRSADAQRMQAEQTAHLVAVYEKHLPHLERSAAAAERHARTTETSSLDVRIDRLLDEFNDERGKAAEGLAKANLTPASSQADARAALNKSYRAKLLEVLDRVSELPEDLAKAKVKSLGADLNASEKLALLVGEFHQKRPPDGEAWKHTDLAKLIAKHDLVGRVDEIIQGVRVASYMAAKEA